MEEAEVWPEDWVPRGSVRAYIGGLGRYSMIMIQLSVYDQFPKQKDFCLESILTGSCASSTFTPSTSSSVFSAWPSLFHRSYQAGSKSTSNWMKLRLISYVNYSILILSLRRLLHVSDDCGNFNC